MAEPLSAPTEVPSPIEERTLPGASPRRPTPELGEPDEALRFDIGARRPSGHREGAQVRSDHEAAAHAFRIGGPKPAGTTLAPGEAGAPGSLAPHPRAVRDRRASRDDARPPARSLAPAYFVIAFLAGVVCHQVALNRALGFGLADAPVTELRVPAPYPVRAKPAPVAAAPRQHVVRSVVGDTSASGLRVSALTSEVDATNGLVFWTGRVTNATQTAVDAARMTLEARDASGSLIATDTALLQPSRLAAGESAVVQLRVPDDPAIHRWALRAEWLQPTRQELLDSESRPGRLATSAGS